MANNINIQLIPTHPVLKQTILDVLRMKKEQGDNTPLFEAPKNENFPDKNWKKGVNIPEGTNGWFNQSGWSLDTEDGEPTGGINVSLKPNNAQASSGSGSKSQQFGGYKKPFKRTGTYGSNQRRSY
jgi:hypothetical protein